MKRDLAAIASKFDILGEFNVAIPFGTGHINETYQVIYDQGGTPVHYTLQRINTNVFRDPVALMENVDRVTSHIRAKLEAETPRSNRRTLYLLRNRLDNKPYYVDEEGAYWRCYIFVENARTFDVLEKPSQAYAAAQAFGRFQLDLADMPSPRLHETIPHFHDTPDRIAKLEAAVKKDVCHRSASVAAEIDFIFSRADEAGKLIELNRRGLIPERITHNDTKLNNVLIDDRSKEGICVLDLDTVMPGLAHYDFGDMVRTGTSPAPEDELDLGKVTMRFEFFEALLRGYLAGCGGCLNRTERENLPFSGKLITLEIGCRFLTDYLEGDVYFRIHREQHNLDRCRTQLALVRSIEEQYAKMCQLEASID
ncbi:MAG: aminoglycoside phosphotransferase family protein [Victivallaceae bacterium]|nr:aminoglycoside phosphotransferase family protein [Victivallaceae bacterium]